MIHLGLGLGLRLGLGLGLGLSLGLGLGLGLGLSLGLSLGLEGGSTRGERRAPGGRRQEVDAISGGRVISGGGAGSSSSGGGGGELDEPASEVADEREWRGPPPLEPLRPVWRRECLQSPVAVRALARDGGKIRDGGAGTEDGGVPRDLEGAGGGG